MKQLPIPISVADGKGDDFPKETADYPTVLGADIFVRGIFDLA